MRITAKILIWGIAPLISVACFAATTGSDFRLAEAAKNRDKDTVRSLLKQHADVNAPLGKGGATALGWAAHWNDLETADLLIHAGANVNAANSYGVTPLWEACNNGSGPMVEKLAPAGANPNATLPGTGETVLMRCASAGNAGAVKALLEHGADLKAKELRKDQTALMWAIEERHPEAARLLIEHGSDVHARSKGGFTPLLFAARQGDIQSARLLLEEGVDVNEAAANQGPARGGYGEGSGPPAGLSALLIAADSGHEDFAVYLVEKGANTNAADSDGFTALHYSLRKGISLLKFAHHGNFYSDSFSYLFRPTMSKLAVTLLEHGANPNAQVAKGNKLAAMLHGSDRPMLGLAGATPFLLAAAAGDVSMMRTLIAKGADPKLTTRDHTTPLMVAAGLSRREDRRQDDEKNAVEAVKLIVELGADVNATNDDGATALHAAAFTGANEIIQFLVDKGARLDIPDRFGQTPLSIAEGDPNGLVDDHERNIVHKATADLLRKLGANTVPQGAGTVFLATVPHNSGTAGFGD
jgi:ankyrin repeat protein